MVAGGIAQCPAIETATRLGYETVVIDGSDSAPGFELADHSEVVDIRDVQAVLTCARKYSISGVTTVACEVAMPAVALVVDTLGLPGLGVEQTRVVTNKFCMREAWREAGLPGPRYKLCRTQEEARLAVDEIGLPVVVKPTDSSGSRGVRKIDNKEEVESAFSEARRFSSMKEVLVEEFIIGEEVSFEAFAEGETIRCLAVSQKQRTPAPYLMDVEVDFPSEQSSGQVAEIFRIGTAAAKALGVRDAPIHMELMMSPKGPIPVELAARGPGSGVYTTILPIVSGIDLVAHQLQLAMGDAKALRLKASPSPPAVVLRFLYATRAGVISTLQSEGAKQIDGVVEVLQYKNPGDAVVCATNGTDRVAHLITTGPTLATARTIADRASESMQLELCP